MLSENLKVLRKQKGFSQEELAVRVNVVRQTVSKWEKGLSAPDADAVIKLAEVFGVSVNELLGEEIKTEENRMEVAEQLSRLNALLAIQMQRKQQLRKNIFTVIGIATKNPALMVIDFSAFANMQWIPEFTFVQAFRGIKDIDAGYIATIAVAYIPVAFVVFAEHIADHKNLSSIIGTELLEEPGLHRTLLGDGVGSIVGAFFGGCPNTTYGESVACVAITGNASVITILVTAILAMVASFVAPFVTFLATIPNCVMGGVCIALYGFIAVSGLKMIQQVDLGENKNLFVVATILITGIGGFTLTFGKITLTSIACALILGILVNLMVSNAKVSE